MRIPASFLWLAPLALALAACGGNGSSGDNGGPAPVFAIINTAMPDAVAGVPYQYQFHTAHGTAPVTWAFDAAFVPPVWMNLGVSGLLTGTPAAAGAFSVAVTATDSAGRTAARSLALDVTAAPEITTTSLARAIKGQAYAAQVLHSAPASVAVSFAVTGGVLPAGISFSAGGAFSGTTTEGGLFEV
jgi:hypothetical protein